MIRKLKTKFILLSMIAFSLLLGIIVAGMNLINYHAVVAEADATLSILSLNKGHFPVSGSDGKDEDDHKGRPFPPGMSPELPYESRYFSVLFSQDGKVLLAETSRIVSVDTASAIAYAKTVLLQGKAQGFLDRFRFASYEDEGQTRIIFLDCDRKLSSFRTFLYSSIGMALAGILVVFLIIFFFAGRILRPIAESYEKQKRFITDAGHEIKTPLTIIGTNTDILEMEQGENECLQDIRQQTDRLKSLTNDLVSLARMEEMEEDLSKIEFPLSEVAAETVKPFQKLAAQQGKDFTCHIQPLLSFVGNDEALRRLLSILLDNALKYSPEGGAVSFDLEKQGRTLCLTVTNTTALPVPPESLPHVFDRFYRTDVSRNSETGGHGIGLSIAKSIVMAHKGKIQALAPEEKVFRIRVQLPA